MECSVIRETLQGQLQADKPFYMTSQEWRVLCLYVHTGLNLCAIHRKTGLSRPWARRLLVRAYDKYTRYGPVPSGLVPEGTPAQLGMLCLEHRKPPVKLITDALNQRHRFRTAAEELGVTTMTLYHWTQRYKIKRLLVAHPVV
jgi:hypothetical protein